MPLRVAARGRVTGRAARAVCNDGPGIVPGIEGLGSGRRRSLRRHGGKDRVVGEPVQVYFCFGAFSLRFSLSRRLVNDVWRL